MGPWVHGGWVSSPGRSLGRVKFDQPTSEQFQKEVLLPFFEQYLRDVAPKAPIAKATVFETGTNVWRRYDTWPPREAKPRSLYFAAGGRLTFTPPQAGSSAFDSWVSDPAKPVPFIGYTAMGMPQEYMVSDQRFAASRPDVLTYRSEVLDEDLTVVGPITARLFGSTSGTDADWVVKLIDVYPADVEEAPPGRASADRVPKMWKRPRSPSAATSSSCVPTRCAGGSARASRPPRPWCLARWRNCGSPCRT